MISFTIPMKPFSVNATHYRDKRHKTAEFKNWELDVLRFLNKVDFSGLDTKATEYSVELTFFYPEEVFYTDAGKVSARTMDLSNVEKPVLDMIFNRWLGIDDRYITELVSRKDPRGEYAIKVRIVAALSLEAKTSANPKDAA